MEETVRSTGRTAFCFSDARELERKGIMLSGLSVSDQLRDVEAEEDDDGPEAAAAALAKESSEEDDERALLLLKAEELMLPLPLLLPPTGLCIGHPGGGERELNAGTDG